jgi:RHH-type proline utilization regulon transcriptional repressor/proline dehydrogenase/delta 1-pyrroline-5-carboxylate dehydrogenase
VPAAPAEAGIDPSRPGRPAYRWRSASEEDVRAAIAAAGKAGPEWAARDPAERRQALLGAANSLACRRGELLAVMARDAGKTVREGDPEVSEAIDFATYYAAHIPAADDRSAPLGTVVVASPWNFPLSIPAGGVLAALAAGNAVILKPAPEAVATAGALAEALWAGGVPKSVLQFAPCVDGDASRVLITDPAVDAVVLTGSWETARMFLHWRPHLNLHAETSGKNAIVITATADLDEAIADLVHSAFGHAGQKCSAASLSIVEASVYDDTSFLRRLSDAVHSLRVGPAPDPVTSMGPLIHPPEGPLLDALSHLQPGERWLVRPRALDDGGYLWAPGVKAGVAPGSPFHLTECFGPVLGVMRAADLEEATAWQNQPDYGLTAGLHALDPREIEWWRDRVEAGNLYVNRGTTGAIVQRQPFGGWKRSVVGPGAKAGGPNYVASLRRFDPPGPDEPDQRDSFRRAWDAMNVPQDPSGLAAEANAFRYRPLRSVLVCVGTRAADREVAIARAAGAAVGARVQVGGEDHVLAAAARTDRRAVPDKVRFLGDISEQTKLAAVDAGLWVDSIPVACEPHRELMHWVREQSISETLHRHGNITGRRRGITRQRPHRP